MVAVSTGVRAGLGVGLRRRRRGAPGGRECSDMSSMQGTATQHQVARCEMSRPAPHISHRTMVRRDVMAATIREHEGRTHRQRLPPTRRAALPGPRSAIVDEPDQPAESWGTITYAEMAARARAQAAALDAHGHRRRRAGRHRQPQLGPPAHRAVRRQRQRSGARADQLPARRRGGEVHRRASAAPAC